MVKKKSKHVISVTNEPNVVAAEDLNKGKIHMVLRPYLQAKAET
jgi:hypothetical protein